MEYLLVNRVKVIIAGSRSIKDNIKNARKQLSLFLLSYLTNHKITEIVSGTAAGADRLGEQFGADLGIPVNRKPADWDSLGKAAGIIRNREMAEYADEAIILWDGVSRGSKNMIDEMKKLGKPYHIILVE